MCDHQWPRSNHRYVQLTGMHSNRRCLRLKGMPACTSVARFLVKSHDPAITVRGCMMFHSWGTVLYPLRSYGLVVRTLENKTQNVLQVVNVLEKKEYGITHPHDFCRCAFSPSLRRWILLESYKELAGCTWKLFSL